MAQHFPRTWLVGLLKYQYARGLDSYSFLRVDLKEEFLNTLLMNRDRYLGAIYSLIESWVKAGRPPGNNPIGFRYLSMGERL